MTDFERNVQELLDRQRISDTLYRYASSVDDKDWAGVESTMAPEIRGEYGTNPAIEGRNNVVSWMKSATADRAWQHHKLTVYHIDFSEDRNTAHALTYHTSHQTTDADPDTVIVIIARYHDDLRRDGDRWVITKKVMEIGWRETRGH